MFKPGMRYLALLSCVWCSQNICLAADTLSLPITVTATIVIPPCTLNGGNPLDVDFGEIQVRDVNNNLHPEKRTIVKRVGIICPAAVTSTNDLKVTMNGSQASAGNNILLATGGHGAGIALYQRETSGTALPLNQSVALSGLGSVSGDTTNGFSGQLSFTSMVVKAGTANVTEGEFAATATLLLKQE